MRKTFKNVKIGFQNKLLIIFNISILIPMIIFGSSMFYVTQKKILSKSTMIYEQTAEQINSVFTEYVSQIDKINLGVSIKNDIPDYLKYTSQYIESSREEIYEAQKASYTHLQELSEINNDIFSVSVVTLDGDVLTCGNGIYRNDYFDINSDYYSPLRTSSGNMVLLSPKNTNYTFQYPQKVFSIGRRYMDYSTTTHDGLLTYTGYIIVECSINKFDDICSNVNFGENSDIFVLDSNGSVVYSTTNDINFKSKIQSLKGKTQIKNKGISYLIASNTSKYTGWQVIGTIPYSDVYASIKTIRTTYILLCSACILMVFLASFYISKKITLPIRDLQTAMKKVENGNFNATVPIYSTTDEFGDLSVSFNRLTQELKSLINKTAVFQQKEKEAQYKLLISQINPHFLYNTLDSIRMLSIIGRNEDVTSSLENLSFLFRYLVNQKESFVKIDEELKQIERYISLQKIRFEDLFIPEYSIENSCLNCYAPKIILQPIVENAILHGITSADHNCILTIKITKLNNKIHFEISDDGVGIDDDKLEELKTNLLSEDINDHVGLSNINARLEFYFGSESKLHIFSQKNIGTTISFDIPIIEKLPDSFLPYREDALDEQNK